MRETIDVFFQYILPGFITLLGVIGLCSGKFQSWLSDRVVGGAFGIACSLLYIAALPLCALAVPLISPSSLPHGSACVGLMAVCVLPAEALAWLFGRQKEAAPRREEPAPESKEAPREKAALPSILAEKDQDQRGDYGEKSPEV
jgi:hypothetical protein